MYLIHLYIEKSQIDLIEYYKLYNLHLNVDRKEIKRQINVCPIRCMNKIKSLFKKKKIRIKNAFQSEIAELENCYICRVEKCVHVHSYYFRRYSLEIKRK